MSLFQKFFRRSGANQDDAGNGGERITRRSNGLAELIKRMSHEGACSVLDLGPTSPTNITFFTGLQHRTHAEDVLRASRDPQYLVDNSEGHKVIDSDRFLTDNLNFEAEQFDSVLVWDACDYMDEGLVKPVVQRIHHILKPGGALLAFFHTKDAGPDAPYFRYHIGAPGTLDLQAIVPSADAHFRLQRVFNNRHIENLFHDYGSIKFFLGRDNIREVLVIR